MNEIDDTPLVPEVISADTEIVDPDAGASGFTTKDNYPVALKNKAYDMYMNDSVDDTDIALELSVPVKVIKSWKRKGKWVKKKEELEDVGRRESEARFVGFVAKNKIPEATRQLQLTKDIEELIQAAVTVRLEAAKANGNDVNILELERLTKALEKVANVGARLMKINDLPEGVDKTGQPLQQGGRAPLVVIGVGANPVTPITIRENQQED